MSSVNLAKMCSGCHRTLQKSKFSSTKSPFFVDGLLPLCNECLDAEVHYQEGNWNYVNRLCQWVDIPWVPEQFTKIYSSVPQQAASTYIKFFNQAEYSRVHWEDYEEKWKAAIAENREKVLHPVFNMKELEKLRLKWGAEYSQDDYYSLEELYNGLVQSFGVSTTLGEREAMLLAKLSLQMDQCVAAGGAGIDKLVTAYNNIKKSAGFEADNAKDNNEFSSVSELVMYMEKVGWKNKFHNKETRDIVDNTMKNFQNYARRLYQNEASMSDQVESTLEAKRRMDALEMQNFDDVSDAYELEAYGVNLHKEDSEEDEEFVPDLEV